MEYKEQWEKLLIAIVKQAVSDYEMALYMKNPTVKERIELEMKKGIISNFISSDTIEYILREVKEKYENKHGSEVKE